MLKRSSIRAALFMVLVPISLIFFAMAFVILSSLWNGNPVDYEGLAILTGALSAPITGAGAVKAYQKKYETSSFENID